MHIIRFSSPLSTGCGAHVHKQTDADRRSTAWVQRGGGYSPNNFLGAYRPKFYF